MAYISFISHIQRMALTTSFKEFDIDNVKLSANIEQKFNEQRITIKYGGKTNRPINLYFSLPLVQSWGIVPDWSQRSKRWR